MPSVNLNSDLIEYLLTPQEVNTAMQLCNKDLSIAYLQNSRVNLIRTLSEQTYSKPEDDIETHRVRAYHKGQVDLLEALIRGAMEPTPVPVEDVSESQSQSQPFIQGR